MPDDESMFPHFDVEDENTEDTEDNQNQSEDDDYHDDDPNQSEDDDSQIEDPDQPEEDDDPLGDIKAKDDDPDAKVDVTLSDGSVVPLSELKSGYFRHSDYTQKTQTVARERDVVEATAKAFSAQQTIITQQQQETEKFLLGLVPDEPDISLITTDLAQYHRAKAMRDKAFEEVQGIVQKNRQTEAQLNASIEQNLKQIQEVENKALKQKFPRLNRPEVYTKFVSTAKETANQMGFTESEFNSTFDHRILSVLYYASLGLKAKQAERTGKPSKTAKNVGTTSINTRLKLGGQRGARNNASALNKLNQSGSIHDAMNVDINI